ncbi:MAG: hypothetical protein V3U52_08160 [Thermoplasmata archaeon]
MLDDRVTYPLHEKPFPFETLRYWYVTPFGGRSEDLSRGQVGINAEALDQNTELIPNQDRVLISIVGHSTRRPLYSRTPFKVVALDTRRPDGLEKSPRGEAVLPRDEPWDFVRRPYLQPRYGEPLLLNGVASRVLGRDPSELLSQLLRQGLGRLSDGLFH